MNAKINILILGGLIIMTSFSDNKKSPQVSKVQEKPHQVVVKNPNDALVELKNGSDRFMKDKLININYKEQIEHTKSGQHPHSVILSCLDSRIPPEIVFDQGIGNIFVARNAGNIEDLNVIGSMEFATKVIGTKLIVVMGHNHCGAVKGAIEDAELGNLTQLVEQIKPAISKNKNKDVVHDETAKNNVKMTIADILSKSPVIRELIREKKLKIVGAFYDLTSGKIIFLE